MIIIHGDYHLESRNFLNSEIARLKASGKNPHYLEGEKLTVSDLETSFLTTSMFQEDFLVIEKLLTRPSSRAKELCLNLLINHQGKKEVLLWEAKALPKTQLSPLDVIKPSVKLFKLPMPIFNLIATFSPRQKDSLLANLHSIVNQDNEQFLFSLLAKQIGNLIVAKSAPNQLSLAPWQKSKIMRQANDWSLPQLISTHTRLLEIDHSIKSGRSSLDLISHLDLLIMEL